MNPSSFMKEIPQGSPSYQRRNPNLFRHCPPDRDDRCWREDEEAMNLHGKWGFKVGESPKPAKRIRQSSKPLLNKLESDWFNYETIVRPASAAAPWAQSIRFRLANGLWYKPDFFSFDYPSLGELNRPTAWEIKGPHAFRGGFENLKMFAHQYPEIRVILAWKEKSGQWLTQRILP